MKKIVTLFLVFILTFSVLGCSSSKQNQSAGTTSTVILKATIIEVSENSFIVEPVEGSSELKSADRFNIPIEKMDTSREPQVGDVLEITYNGDIMETDPAQLGEIENIKLSEVDKKTIGRDSDNTNTDNVTEATRVGEKPQRNKLTDEDVENARIVAVEYYNNTVFKVLSMERIPEDKMNEGIIQFEVECSKGGEKQDPNRMITLDKKDSDWVVINEGY